MSLPHPNITPIPNTEPDAVPSLWNDRYVEIDKNFKAIDKAVKDLQEQVGDTGSGLREQLDELTRRVNAIDAVSGEALSQAVRLNWIYGISRMELELFTPDWSLRDLDPLPVTSAISGDDSLDVSDTSGLAAGQDYVVWGGGKRETVRVVSILTEHRIRIVGNLVNTYDADAKLARTDWSITHREANSDDGGIYYSKPINLGEAATSNIVVVRCKAGATQVRLWFTDATHPVWTECPQASSSAFGVNEQGMSDCIFKVPSTGEHRLKFQVSGGALQIRHIAAVTGKANTLSGYGIQDAYTKPEIDSMFASIPRAVIVSTPIVSGTSSVTPGTDFSLSVSATSLISGGSISSFELTKPDGGVTTKAAGGGSAVFSGLRVSGAEGEVRHFKFVAIDMAGNRSNETIHNISITNNNAPSMTGFAHNVPASIAGKGVVTVQFWGATDTDGDTIAYSIDSGTSGLVFSKISGIAANESVTMTAPDSVLLSTPISFVVSAEDPKGGTTGVTIGLSLIGVNSWSFATVGVHNFSPPVDGIYEITAVGGGGGGGNGAGLINDGAGGGGGGGGGVVATTRAPLYAGVALPVTIGAGGPGAPGNYLPSGNAIDGNNGSNGSTTSVGTILSALGGGYGGGGGAIGAGKSGGTPNGGAGGRQGLPTTNAGNNGTKDSGTVGSPGGGGGGGYKPDGIASPAAYDGGKTAYGATGGRGGSGFGAGGGGGGGGGVPNGGGYGGDGAGGFVRFVYIGASA